MSEGRRRCAVGAVLLLAFSVAVGVAAFSDQRMTTTPVGHAYDFAINSASAALPSASPAITAETSEGTRATTPLGGSPLSGALVVATEAGAGADNVANGVRLRAQLTGEEIAGGHAFDKHVVELGEFPGITTRSEFASTIEDVVTNGEMRTLSNGRTAYWDDSVVVIRNPGAVDGGTAFRPTDGYDYFLGLP